MAADYILDSNVFIEAKNGYYAFEICPGFWDGLLTNFNSGDLCSITEVKDEITRGKDDLAGWAKKEVPKRFFKGTNNQGVVNKYRDIVAWVQANSQFSRAAKSSFATGADGWIIAFAWEHDATVITHEQLREGAKNTVPMPNVCEEFEVSYMDPFAMLQDLGVRFVLDS